MTATEQSLLLFGGVLAVLVVASIVGFALARRHASSAPNPTIDNLNSRIKAWWLMVIVIGLAFAFGKAGVIILFALASLAALREFITLTPTRRGDHAALAVGFFVVLPLQYYLIWIEWYGLYSIFIPVYAFLLLPIIVAVRGDTRDFMGRVAEIQWGLMICVFCLSHVPALITLPIPGFAGRGLLLIAFLVLVVQSGDVLQYVWGKLLGRHQIAPRLSPSKTVEGTVGGILSATLLGAALWWITPFSAWQAGLIALAINLMGFCGGLVMSAIKRDRGVKDWGAMIEGHGGVLDRLDSVIFAAPIFFQPHISTLEIHLGGELAILHSKLAVTTQSGPWDWTRRTRWCTRTNTPDLSLPIRYSANRVGRRRPLSAVRSIEAPRLEHTSRSRRGVAPRRAARPATVI